MSRSILAVIAGYLLVAAAVVATFAALSTLVPGAFESTAWLVFLVGLGFAWGGSAATLPQPSPAAPR